MSRALLPRGRLVVVSPHLDDAILSLGASISRAARGGATVIVLTALAGDPLSATPAGSWDERSGFSTFGEAITTRRAEDERACAVVGAIPRWLPFADWQYGAPVPAALAAALEPELAGAETVLVTGFPMTNRDHLLVARAVLEATPPGARLGCYLEQPYDWWESGKRRRLTTRTRFRQVRPERDESPSGPSLRWTALEAGLLDRMRKYRACRRYSSQRRLFGRASIPRILLREARRGGEYVAWLENENGRGYNPNAART